MKQFFLFFGCFLLALGSFAQTLAPHKKWGLAWSVPKNWVKSAIGAEGFKFASPKNDNEFTIFTFAQSNDSKKNEEAILNFFTEEVDYQGDFKDLQTQMAKLNLNGLAVQVYEDDEEPDLEDAEEPEDYEGYWSKVLVFNHDKKIVIIYLSEIYNRRRKSEKLFDNIYKTIKKE
jgi:hypothetical protein